MVRAPAWVTDMNAQQAANSNALVAFLERTAATQTAMLEMLARTMPRSIIAEAGAVNRTVAATSAT